MNTRRLMAAGLRGCKVRLLHNPKLNLGTHRLAVHNHLFISKQANMVQHKQTRKAKNILTSISRT